MRVNTRPFRPALASRVSVARSSSSVTVRSGRQKNIAGKKTLESMTHYDFLRFFDLPPGLYVAGPLGHRVAAGALVGESVGLTVGAEVGHPVGAELGKEVGTGVSPMILVVGESFGLIVGVADGASVGGGGPLA